MDADPFAAAATVGIAYVLVALVLAALGWLFFYWVIRMAVKHGILAADRARLRSSFANGGWERERL